jgi:hypothetical protein
MGDDDGSSTLSSLVEGFLYDALAADVNGARCFVEDEDGRSLDDGSRDCETLALAAGESSAAITDLSIISLEQTVS